MMNPNLIMSYIMEAMINSGCTLHVDFWDIIMHEHSKLDMSYDIELKTYNVEMRRERYGSGTT